MYFSHFDLNLLCGETVFYHSFKTRLKQFMFVMNFVRMFCAIVYYFC